MNIRNTITWDGVALPRAAPADFGTITVWETDGMRLEYWLTCSGRAWQKASFWRALRTHSNGTAVGQGATETEAMRNCDHMCQQMEQR